jgi:hypothetical protein
MSKIEKTQTAKHQPPTAKEVVAQQKIEAKKLTEAKKAAAPGKAVVPAKPVATAAPPPDTRSDVQRYLDEIAPAGIAGRLVKFSKDGAFVFADTDEEIAEDAEFIALCDQTLIGWIKFFNDGETPPSRIQGLLYDGFQMPPKATLGDRDPTQWPIGPSGAPEDPWKHQMLLVLENISTHELFTFGTTSITGRTAVGNLLRHYDRMRRSADELPVVRLRVGGFNSKKPGVGWVSVPVFTVCGRTPRGSAQKPDTSTAGDLNDQIPF